VSIPHHPLHPLPLHTTQHSTLNFCSSCGKVARAEELNSFFSPEANPAKAVMALLITTTLESFCSKERRLDTTADTLPLPFSLGVELRAAFSSSRWACRARACVCVCVCVPI